VSTASGRPLTPPGIRNPGKRALAAAWVWITGVCLTALIATYLLFVEPPPPRKIVIAAGARDGAYFHYAQKYAEALRAEGLAVEVRTTAGSVENLRLLGQSDSGVALAIVQGGVASPEQVERFYALGSLYREPLWVFYRGDEPLERASQLAGQRIGTGPPGSGTYSIATKVLDVNGVVEPRSPGEGPRTVLVQQDAAATATALRRGDLDAAFFVAAFEAEYIQGLLRDKNVALLSFGQQEAYRRRFRFLAPVTLPAGMVDLGRNLPRRDVALLAPTAMLVVRKEFHPALVPLVLATAARIHGKGDEVSNPGEFPSAAYCDFAVSEDAKRFYKSGQPVLQRLLPFWVASLADRTKVMLIPLIMLLMPLLRTAPPLMRWRTRRKIYLWYSGLREIDSRMVAGLSAPELAEALARLDDIERQVAQVDVPLSYMEELYHLRMHLVLLRNLLEARSHGERATVPFPAEREPLR
jgi:TRAP transporter TAXI family solute receptor